MNIYLTFKRLPRGGKYIMNNKYYVAYNTKGSVRVRGNKTINYRLPKFIWDRI